MIGEKEELIYNYKQKTCISLEKEKNGLKTLGIAFIIISLILWIVVTLLSKKQQYF